MIKFIYRKKKAIPEHSSDVRITLRKHNNQSNQWEITFYNFSWEKVFNDSDYGICGIENDRVYFSKADKNTGYKIYYPSRTYKSTKCMKFTYCEGLFACEGKLMFDDENKLYYIEK